MSFGRIIKQAIEQKEDTGKPSIVPAVNKAILAHDSGFFQDILDFHKLPSKYEGSYRPSQLHNACERMLFYSAGGEEKSDPEAGKPNPRLQMIFDVGSWWHLYLQYLLDKSGILEGCEVRAYSKELGIEGRAEEGSFIQSNPDCTERIY